MKTAQMALVMATIFWYLESLDTAWRGRPERAAGGARGAVIASLLAAAVIGVIFAAGGFSKL